jgi:hypothetical protein
MSEDGKWIEFEYYHWLHQEYRTGWALKKYFQRVARFEPLAQARQQHISAIDRVLARHAHAPRITEAQFQAAREEGRP